METLLNFKYYDLVAITLFIFVMLASGVFSFLFKQAKKNIETRKLYPELIEIYSKYFIMPRGFNPIGALVANEPVFIGSRSPLIWNYKLSFPLSIFYPIIIITGFSIAGIVCSTFLTIKNKSNFSLIIIFILISLIGLFIQKKTKKNILTKTDLLNKEVNVFLEKNNLKIEDVYVPPINNSPLVVKSILFSLWGAFISILMFFVFYFSGGF